VRGFWAPPYCSAKGLPNMTLKYSFYEAACCQAPFSLMTWVTPSVVNRASGFLIREASICLEQTSIRAALFLPDTRCCIRPRAIREAPGNPKRERILTETNGFSTILVCRLTIEICYLTAETDFDSLQIANPFVKEVGYEGFICSKNFQGLSEG